MTFAEIGLHPAILKALTDSGDSEPTPVQKQPIPASRESLRAVNYRNSSAPKCIEQFNFFCTDQPIVPGLRPGSLPQGPAGGQ